LFVLFGVHCRSPTEAAYLPAITEPSTTIEDYREELMLSLGSARQLATGRAQAKYKNHYDQHAKEVDFRVGDWVLVYFHHEQSGRNRKLSKPWHGPYRTISWEDPTVICTKVYYPQHDQIHVHQSRILCPCPSEFPAGYFWYGNGRKGPGRSPRWVDAVTLSWTH
jgi:hypothetical protein